MTEGSAPPRRVLVTGAAGRIGTAYAQHAAHRYALRLMVLPGDEHDLAEFGEVVSCDLSDLERLKEVCAGCDAVVHLAATPDPSAVWDVVLASNIIGTYNLFAAAKAAGCRRVVYASSVHAVSGYPPDVQVKTSEPVNPGDLYGVSKCFGEALGRYMAEREGLAVIALRIGAFTEIDDARESADLANEDIFVSPADLCQLIDLSLDAENIQFAIFHAISNNRFKRLDISDARRLLGYAPHDDFTAVNEKLRSLSLGEAIRSATVDDAGQQSGMREQV